MIGVLNTDGSTPTRITADASAHSIDVDDNTTGSDAGPDAASRDGNGATTLLATDANGNIIPLFVTSAGKLLIQTT